MTAEQAAEAERLEAIGYLDATDKTAGQPVVPRWDRARAEDGLNLLTSGHAAEVQLLDMDGAVVHRWSMPWATAFPASKLRLDAPGTHHFRRARLGADGTIYGVFEGRGMVAVAADGTLRWARENGAHHDLQLVDGGRTVLALVREARLDPRVRTGRPFLDDAVAWIDARDGEERARLSIWEAVIASDLVAEVRARRPDDDGDLLHTNSVFLLDGRHAGRVPEWTAGRVLVSLREPSVLLVLDPDTGKVVWWMKGDFRRQHDAEVDALGRLWVFDNVGGPVGARVLALDAATGGTLWSWGHTDTHPLRSVVLGSAQQLPKGHVLITESNGGRALEVDPEDGAIVWELINPNRAGPGDTLVATVFEVERIPRAAPGRWASPPGVVRATASGHGATP